MCLVINMVKKMQDIQRTVKKLIASQLNLDAELIEGTASLKDKLNIDSMDSVELILRLEDTFGIDFPLNVAANIETVQDMIDYVKVNFDSELA